MRMIEKLSKQIKSEIKDARDYIELANKYKAENKELSEMYYTLATEEMSHSERLHKSVVREIDKHKATDKEVPTAMLAVWDYEHGNIIEETTELKIMIEIYRK